MSFDAVFFIHGNHIDNDLANGSWYWLYRVVKVKDIVIRTHVLVKVKFAAS